MWGRNCIVQYFLGVGFGLVLLSTTLVVVLVLNRQDADGAEDTQDYQQYNREVSEDAITFEDFISRSFSAKTFNGSWWSSSELQWKDKVVCCVVSIFETICTTGW